MDDCMTENERTIFAILGPIAEGPVELTLGDRVVHGVGLLCLGVRGDDYVQAIRRLVKTFGAEK